MLFRSICYTTIALVTDYDCWHPDHDSVTVDMIVANLTQNAVTAQRIIAGAVDTSKLATDSVTGVKILAGAVGELAPVKAGIPFGIWIAIVQSWRA